MTDVELEPVSAARAALEAAQTLPQVKLIRDQVEAVRHLMRQQGVGLEQQNAAAEIKLRCERRLGEMLTHIVQPPRWLRDETTGQLQGGVPTLPDGINKVQAYRWRVVASLPETRFAEWLEAVRRVGGELTSAGLLTYAKEWIRLCERSLDLGAGGADDVDAPSDGCAGSGDAEQDRYTRTLLLFIAIRELEQHDREARALADVFGTANLSATLLAARRYAYRTLVGEKDGRRA